MSGWFKAIRTSGELGEIGEFHVEDSNGTEWQVRAEVKPVDRRISEHDTIRWNYPVCLNAGYQCSKLLSWDLIEACEELIKQELADKKQEQKA